MLAGIPVYFTCFGCGNKRTSLFRRARAKKVWHMYNVLYVDDDPNLLEVARFFLGDSKGIILATSTLATEALNLPDFDHFDAIISDYEMPRMNGIAFLKKVRETHGDIPFILFTGKGREEVVIDAINNGADFYLQKGGDPTSQFAELAHKIKKSVERRQAVRALQDSERRYRNLYHYALVGLFETRLGDAKIVACNQKYVEMSGFSSIEEAIGSDVLQLYANPDDRNEVSRILHEEGSIDDHEVRLRNKKTGQFFWARFSARIDREKDIAEGTIIDISERKSLETDLAKKHGELLTSYEQLTLAKTELRRQFDQLAGSERTLRINEERLVMAQRIGHTGSWEYDLGTKTIWGSAEALHIFGFPPVAGDFPIAEIESCIMENERVHQALVDLITQGAEYNLEYLINPADGSPGKVIHSIARLEKDAGGSPVRVIGVIHDITRRKRGEEEIAFKNIILSTQQEAAPDAILIVDENGKILSYNKKFTDIWGISDHLIASREDEPVLQYVLQQQTDPEVFLSRVRYLYDHKEERSFEELLLKDGRVLERFSAPMLGEAGKYFGRVWYFRDITGRRKGEKNLKESEARFHSLYSHMIEGAALHELRFNEAGSPEDYVILETNPAFERHLGISRASVVGKTGREAYGVADPPYLELYARVAMTGRPEVFETYFPPLEKHFSISVYCPAPGRFATIFEDITERKGAEEALRNSEGRLHSLVQTIPDLIWLKDKEGVYLACNPMFERFFGAKEAEILGKTDYDFVNRELADFFRKNDCRAMAAGVPTRNEEWITFADDGHRSLLETTKTPMFDDKGALLGVLGIGRDITERKRAEDELHASEQKFSTVFQNNPVSLTLVSAASGAFVAVNDAFLESTGYMQEEVIGRTTGELGIFVDKEESKRMVALLQEQHSLVGFELRARKKNGDIRTCLFSSSIIQMGGTPHILSTVEDITEQKKAEDKLRESEERYRSVVENAGEGIVIAQGNTLVFVNSTIIRMLRTTGDRLLNHPFIDYIHPGDRPLVQERYLQRLKGEDVPDNYDFRLVNESGNILWVHISSVRILWGKKPATLSFLADITETRLAEEALRESEEKYRLLVENSHDAVYIYRGDRFIFINRRVSEFSGFTPEELMKMSIWDLVHPDDRSELQEFGRMRFSGLPAPSTYSARIITRGGEILRMEFAVDRIMIRGELAVLGMARDISDRQ